MDFDISYYTSKNSNNTPDKGFKKGNNNKIEQ